jgi:hypothetical protein
VLAAKHGPVAALLTAALALSLSACAAPAHSGAEVVVRVLPSAHPEAYEVHLAQAKGDFRSSFRLRSGQSRSVAVPSGWVTVRVAGLCVVPAPASGTTTVEVRRNDCRIT